VEEGWLRLSSIFRLALLKGRRDRQAVANPTPYPPLYHGVLDASLLTGLDVVERYEVGEGVKVIVGVRDGTGYYLVEEPSLTPGDMLYYESLMKALRGIVEPSAEMFRDPVGYLESYIERAIEEYGLEALSSEVRGKIMYYVKRDSLGYGPLDPLIRDPRIEDVSMEGVGKPVRVFHRDYNDLDWLTTNIRLDDERYVDHLAIKLAHLSGKHVSAAFPVVDATLPERHRVTVTYSREVTPFGSSITIRKFREEPLTICHLMKSRTISPLMAAYWWLLLENKAFVLIVGPMASGKTTLLNALATLLKPNWKVVSIEDNQELRLPHVGWKPLVARHTYTLGETVTEVKLFDLVKLSLRERADFIIVGEVRGEEAQALVQAAALGHGCACTFHGDGFETMVQRLTSPPINVGESFIPLITNVVVIKRLAPLGGKPVRRVVEVLEVVSAKECRSVFKWDPQLDVHLPLTVDEAVDKSKALSRMASLTGWSSKGLKSEMRRREEFLKGLLEANVLHYNDVVAELRKFYAEA
jgi:flagellar protein FlaI